MAMTLFDLENRVRANTRDLSNSIFRQQDIDAWLNEAIDRCREVVPELRNMASLINTNDVPTLLPDQYHSLLAIYASSRCFFQDSSFYQATTLMNEFETKLEELHQAIQAGEVSIADATGTTVSTNYYQDDDVTDVYFGSETVITFADGTTETVNLDRVFDRVDY